ncbi:MAG: LptF/LptG family permease [Bacteroidaceae bacterium]|nr:LptF/LptG family permease [Bacteroidaceae bacterium]
MNFKGNFKLIYKLDWYIIKKFLGTYFFSIALIIAISVIFDYNEHIDKLKDAAPSEVLFDYYLNFIPYFASLFSPLFVFIAVIFFTSKIADGSEIIAMFSTGVSFNRLLRPYMLSAAFIALFNFALGSYVIPVGSRTRVAFTNKYFERNTSSLSASNIQIEVEPGVIAYMQRYEDYNNTAYSFSLDKFEDKLLVSHMTARTATYDTVANGRFHWELRSYNIRNLSGNKEIITKGLSLDTVIKLEPSDFLVTEKQEETMTSPELRKFIARQKERGVGNVTDFQIEYNRRISMSFASFILTLIGVSLSSRKRKGGMGLYLAIGLGLSFGYILFQSITSTFAVSGAMSPFWAEWLPNIIFVPIAIYLYFKAPR